MKASKFIVLVGGILGILAFFLPMVSVHREGSTGTVSAFQVIKGLEAITVQTGTHEAQVALADAGSSTGEAQDALGKMKGIVAAVFVPALLLLLIGGVAVARKKFQRTSGAFALVIGLVGLGIAAILNGAAEGDGGIAISLLLATGTAGVIGGIIGLIKPERPVLHQPTSFPAMVAA